MTDSDKDEIKELYDRLNEIFTEAAGIFDRLNELTAQQCAALTVDDEGPAWVTNTSENGSD